jgi:hypothetical protein
LHEKSNYYNMTEYVLAFEYFYQYAQDILWGPQNCSKVISMGNKILQVDWTLGGPVHVHIWYWHFPFGNWTLWLAEAISAHNVLTVPWSIDETCNYKSNLQMLLRN